MWTTAICPGEMEKEIFSSWGFIAGFGPFPAAPQGGFWLKVTTNTVIFSKTYTMTLVNCSLQSKPHRAACSLLVTWSCIITHQHYSFLWRQQRTIGCLQTTASSTSPTQTTDQRSPLSKPQGSPRGSKEQMPSSILSARHRDCAASAICDRRENISH